MDMEKTRIRTQWMVFAYKCRFELDLARIDLEIYFFGCARSTLISQSASHLVKRDETPVRSGTSCKCLTYKWFTTTSDGSAQVFMFIAITLDCCRQQQQ